MMTKIKTILESFKDVTYYQVTKNKQERYELYFVHKNLETARSVNTTNYKVTVFNLHDDGLGQASFTVFASDSDEEIKTKISDAILTAKLINNKPYRLPEKEELEIPNESNIESYGLKEAAKIISEACFKADNKENGGINALEVFVTKKEIEIINSNGLDKKETTYDAFVEAIPTWNNENESVELYESFKFDELDPKKITLRLLDKMQEVELRSKATKPKEPLNVKVALKPLEASEFFDELTYEVNANVVYSHSNKYKIGDKLQTSKTADPLYVIKRGVLKGSAYSKHFDDDGTNTIDTEVISKGTYVNMFGNNRYSSYLKMKPTGTLPNIEVKPGSLDLTTLDEDYFECVSLSGLQLDIYNDYIGGEIRLGYLHTKDGIKPLTGISFSASISEVLNNMKLSTEVVQEEYYLGPKIVLLDKVKIS